MEKISHDLFARSCQAPKPYRPKLVLIRGLQGSGKSTYTQRAFSRCAHFESDMFFTTEGTYKFDVEKLRDAHERCLGNTKKALSENMDVAVSNTFSQAWEMKAYVDFARDNNYRLLILCMSEFDCEVLAARNTHGVTLQTLLKKKREFSFPSEREFFLDNGDRLDRTKLYYPILLGERGKEQTFITNPLRYRMVSADDLCE